MHPGPEEDPGTAPGIAPGHRVIGIEVDTPAAPHPTHCQGVTVGNCRGQAQVSLDDDEVGEDDFQTLHTPVCHMVR